VCFVQSPFEDNPVVRDYFNKEHTITSREDLYQLYLVDAPAQIQSARDQGFKGDMKEDEYLTWMIKRRFCPRGIVSNQSMYLLEQIGMLDGEMGLTLPCDMSDISALFVQALRIIRGIKAEGKE